MPKIQTINLVKRFEKVTAVNRVNFTVGDGEYVSIVGPSGCGKSTVLRMLVGLEKPTQGEILFDGKPVTGLLPEDRNIGFLFQSYELFPHLTVGENVEYGLFVRAVKKADIGSKSSELLKLVKLLQFSGYYPIHLSGGMQQRVALARALATGSRLLLLDEPLSALDEKAAVMLRYEIQKSSKRLGLTVIHVSHNQETALSSSDKIIVMRSGKVVQSGPPRDVYLNPSSPYVAYFLGDSNFIEATVTGQAEAEASGIRFRLPEKPPSRNVILAIRPEKAVLNDKNPASFNAVVMDVNFLGYTTEYAIQANELKLRVRTAKHDYLKKGDGVTLRLPPKDMMVFSDEFDLSRELSPG